MKTPLIFSLLISLFFATACGDDCIEGRGETVTQTLAVTDFTAITLYGSEKVTISQGNEFLVVATGQQNILDRLNTRVNNDRWEIRLLDDCYRNYDLEIRVTMPVLEEASLIGSGDVLINDFEDQQSLDLLVEGSGNIVMQQFTGAQQLTSRIIGSGDIRCEAGLGNLQTLDVDIEGSGNFYGFPAVAQIGQVRVEGSGDAEVTVTDQLNVIIDGSGNVYYKGNPSINQTITGSGELINAN